MWLQDILNLCFVVFVSHFVLSRTAKIIRVLLEINDKLKQLNLTIDLVLQLNEINTKNNKISAETTMDNLSSIKELAAILTARADINNFHRWVELEEKRLKERSKINNRETN